MVTTSFSMTTCFFQGWKPSFLISTSYSPGARFKVSSVAVLSLPSIKTEAPSGVEVVTRRPVGFKVLVWKSKRSPRARRRAK